MKRLILIAASLALFLSMVTIAIIVNLPSQSPDGPDGSDGQYPVLQLGGDVVSEELFYSSYQGSVLGYGIQISGAANSGEARFVPNPQTPFATQFIQRSEGQQWFMDEVESILNIHAMSINTIATQADLDTIISIGLFDVCRAWRNSNR